MPLGCAWPRVKAEAEKAGHGGAHGRRFDMAAFGLPVNDEPVTGAGPLIGAPRLRKCAIDGCRRQRVLVADADELRPRRDPPGDLAIGGEVQQFGYREIDAVQVVRAGVDEACEIGKAAQMRYAGDAWLDRRQPVAQRRAPIDIT